MLACCWAGYQLYPFIPLLSSYRLRDNLARFLATPISAVEVDCRPPPSGSPSRCYCAR